MGYLAPLSIVLGYLLGSINPAYILARLLKGIDIRQHGTKNAGTRNVYKVLGLGPAVVTAIFDLAKGLAAMGIAHLLGQSEVVVYASGFAAVLGHILPVYFSFRGGEGSATGVAILFFLIGRAVVHDWIPYGMFLPLGLVALAVFVITRLPELVGAFALPYMILLLLLKALPNATIIFMAVILLQLFVFTIRNIHRLRLVELGSKRKPITNWRNFARPLAALFVVFPFFVPMDAVLFLAGAVAAVFLLLDLVRLVSRRVNTFLFKKAALLFKEKEVRQFSSMTLFLIAVFILLLAFPIAIASYAILFLTFGDMAAKFFGLLYGRTPLLTKTLEGALAYFVFSFAAGYVLEVFLPLPLWLLAVGAFIAAATELFSIFGIDDNFTVGLISASTMLGFTTLLK